MPLRICVYCSSSTSIDGRYLADADRTGELLARRGHELVYGGGNRGLMGAVARAAHRNGGRVFGAIPERLKGREGVAYELADELVVTETMAERKALLYGRADGFLVLPGGFGTLEEFVEVLTLRQLGYHGKPIALVNTGGFYDPLLALFEHFYAERFAPERSRDLYHVTGTPEEAVDYLEAYRQEAPG